MPFSKANREPLRCINPQCRSVRHGGLQGGRILLESVGGVFFKESGGDKLAGLFWLFVECGTCGQRRYNPAAVAFDGMGAAVEQTMQAVAARIDEDSAEQSSVEPAAPRRKRLRGAA